MDEQERADGCGCKVGTAITEYGLSGMNEELVRRWSDPEGESVRSLADVFNRRILSTALDAAGVEILDPEVETIYRLLRDEDVSSGMRVTKRRQLERADVDIDQVSDHFISHQTLYRHLTGCLDQSARASTTDPVSSAVDDVEGLVRRTETVVTDRIERLERADALDHQDYRVLVDIAVTCEHCGDVYRFEELLERGGCGCER